ncbi:MAG: hypothetical protein LBD36_01985 [Holosporales bacterium]|nr:hypothetical protein [Holosporales bacterium]
MLYHSACGTDKRIVEANVYEAIIGYIDRLPVAKVVELFVDSNKGKNREARYSPLEHCYLMVRMFTLIGEVGLLEMFDSVLRSKPDGSAWIVDGVLDLALQDGPYVVDLRHTSSPKKSARLIRFKFKSALNAALKDRDWLATSGRSEIFGDVEGLLWAWGTSEYAGQLLHCAMTFCHGRNATDAAEGFFAKSRRAFHLRKPVYMFPCYFGNGAIAQIGYEGTAHYLYVLHNASLIEQKELRLREGRSAMCILLGRRNTLDVDVGGRGFATGSLRNALCLAVFPGVADPPPMRSVLEEILSMRPRSESWGRCTVGGNPVCPDGLPARDPTKADDPLHRFWCWIDDVINITDNNGLMALLKEAAAHWQSFEQIAFGECGYGNHMVVFVWLVLRGYAYDYVSHGAEIPRCAFSPPQGESVFRLVKSIISWRECEIRQLLAISLHLGGETGDAIRRDAQHMVQLLQTANNGWAEDITQLLSTNPSNIRLLGSRWGERIGR